MGQNGSNFLIVFIQTDYKAEGGGGGGGGGRDLNNISPPHLRPNFGDNHVKMLRKQKKQLTKQINLNILYMRKLVAYRIKDN